MAVGDNWQEWLTVTLYLSFTVLIVWRVVVGRGHDDDGSGAG